MFLKKLAHLNLGIIGILWQIIIDMHLIKNPVLSNVLVLLKSTSINYNET
jgi:hypothetical protein